MSTAIDDSFTGALADQLARAATFNQSTYSGFRRAHMPGRNARTKRSRPRLSARTALAGSPPPRSTITPAEYLREMKAIGWRAVSSVYLGKPQHVIEYGPQGRAYDESLPAFRQIQSRVREAGLGFLPRASRYLFDLGLREDVGPFT